MYPVHFAFYGSVHTCSCTCGYKQEKETQTAKKKCRTYFLLPSVGGKMWKISTHHGWHNYLHTATVLGYDSFMTYCMRNQWCSCSGHSLPSSWIDTNTGCLHNNQANEIQNQRILNVFSFCSLHLIYKWNVRGDIILFVKYTVRFAEFAPHSIHDAHIFSKLLDSPIGPRTSWDAFECMKLLDE